MDKITFNGTANGITVEQLVRFGEYNMKVKHFHSQYEIFYIIEGQREFFFNNRQYMAHSGDLILIDTNLIHMTKSASSKDHGYNRVIFYIDYDKMASFDEKYPDLQLVKFLHANYGVYHLDDEQQALFLNIYRDLRILLTNKPSGYQTGMELALLSWFYQLTHSLTVDNEVVLPSADTSAKHKNVYAIADYLSENCDKKISLDELAEHFYMSKYYLCRIFKDVTNYKITEYINIHRIQKATTLLEETNKPISEIADMLGFESLTYFEKTFKTYMTISPLRYRKTKNSVSLQTEQLGILDDTTFLSRDR